jgi:hypothetical protein
MAEWVFMPEEYARTRQVVVAGVTQDGGEATLDADGMYRWVRQRTGEEARVVTQSVSQGFAEDRLKWCYRNAVKENYPLHVPCPAGVEEIIVLEQADLEPVPDEDPDETEA